MIMITLMRSKSASDIMPERAVGEAPSSMPAPWSPGSLLLLVRLMLCSDITFLLPRLSVDDDLSSILTVVLHAGSRGVAGNRWTASSTSLLTSYRDTSKY